MTAPITTPQTDAAARLPAARHAPSFGYAVWMVAQRLIAAAMLLVVAPLLLILYPAIRLSSPGPFLYSQMRPGRGGVPFRAYKLRTMRVGADRNTEAARSVRSGDPMVTAIGRVLRRTKIDEIPQLFNILRGDMALVGPRPIALSFQQELEAKIPGFSARLLVTPGLSSLPQVCVVESQSPEHVVDDWSRRFRMERHYIANQSVAYDLVVIGLTVALVLRTLLSGNLDLFHCALAELSGLPLARVSALMHDRGRASLDALLIKAGLPESTFAAFRVAVDVGHEIGYADSDGAAARLRRRMVERVLTHCETDGRSAEPLLILLRRFATESAREEARVFCEELVAEDAIAPIERELIAA